MTLVGCTSAPSQPTWTDDVAPILQANCIKCHGRNARSGAPSFFRLDVYEGRGAALMAPFVAERAHVKSMPPVAKLAGFQIDTLLNWAATDAPRGEPNPDNQPPQIQIEGFRGTEILTMPYVITDPDFDIVTGSLIVRPVGSTEEELVTDDLHSGVGEAQWFAAGEPDGDYEFIARLRDGHGGREINLGRFRVIDDNGNVEPTVAIISPTRNSILSDSSAPITVTFTIDDPDVGDQQTAIIGVVRGDEAAELATLPDLASGEHSAVIDTSALAAGPNWTLVVSVGRGQARVDRLVISHSTTALRYADVQPLLGTYCDPCHGPNDTVNIPFLYNFSSAYGAIAPFVGPSYSRAILERSMPPKSAESLFDNFDAMPESERARLGEWFAAGAPE